MKKEVKKMTFAAVLAALGATLKILLSIQIGDSMRISIFPIPLLLAGYYLGPIYGLMVGFVTDTAYSFLHPSGVFPSLFAITTMIWGLGGYFLRKIKIKNKYLSFGIIIALTSFLETFGNTMIFLIYGYNLGSLLPRIGTMFARLPVLIIVMIILVEKFKLLNIEETFRE